LNPVNPAPVVFVLFVAFLTAAFCRNKFPAPISEGRFTTIDGLRGYLALFVFLHHSSVWYFYIHTGKWEVPPSNLYTNLGQGGVAFFFMITSFLFFSKMLDSKKKTVNWRRLYISRLLRLVPLYFFVMCLLFSVVAILSGWALHMPFPTVVSQSIQWLAFTMFDVPKINGVELTSTIIARVTWSLPYEWLFYFSLPLLGLACRGKPPFRYVLLSALIVIWLGPRYIATYPPYAFLGGIAAAIMVKSSLVRRLSSSNASSILAIGGTLGTMIFFPSTYDKLPLLILSFAFVIIASGNTLFGLLSNNTSRALGDLSYSVYLLHGFFLFVTFYFIFGIATVRTLSPGMYWLTVSGIAPILIFACFVTFNYIERPFIQRVNFADMKIGNLVQRWVSIAKSAFSA